MRLSPGADGALAASDGASVARSMALDGSLPAPLQPHAVQLYEDDVFLIDTVAQYAAAALVSGNAFVLIATEAHRREVTARLERGGVLARAHAQERFVALDARATMARFLRDGWPDAERFTNVIRPVIAAARERAGTLPFERLGAYPLRVFAAEGRDA
jgi:hypothetical protein